MRGKSDENWRVGQQCLGIREENAAASRLYYAVFQAVLFWAREKKNYDKIDRGVHNDMGRMVQAEGKTRIRNGQLFAELRSLRETADYQPDTPDLTELRELLPQFEQMRVYYLRNAESP